MYSLETSDAACGSVAMSASSGPASGPFANIQVDPSGPLQGIHTDANGVQWFDTAQAVHHYADAVHPNVVQPHHQATYSFPNAAQFFAQHSNNLYHHPPVGVIAEGDYVAADSDHSSMPSLVDAGSSDEWSDDDQFIYDQWDGDDSDSSTDSIPIQARAENDSDFRLSDLDDDYDDYSSDEWDAPGDADEAAALPLPQPADNSPPADVDARASAAVALHQALNDVEARINAADILHCALKVAENRVARSADSCSGALEYYQDT